MESRAKIWFVSLVIEAYYCFVCREIKIILQHIIQTCILQVDCPYPIGASKDLYLYTNYYIIYLYTLTEEMYSKHAYTYIDTNHVNIYK